MRCAALMLVLAVTANAQSSLPWGALPPTPLCAVDQGGRTYKVKSGDTFKGISQRHYNTPEYADAIKHANGLTTDKPQPGTILVIPSKPEAVAPAAPEGAGAMANDKGAANAKSPKNAKNAKGAKVTQIKTVGDLLDVVAERIKKLCGLLGLQFGDDPGFGTKITAAIFVAAFFYILSDMVIFWFGSIAMRFENPSLANAMKVSFGSLGLQGLIVVSVLTILAVSTQATPGVATIDTVRNFSLESRSFQWMGGLAAIAIFLGIPTRIASQVYATDFKRAGGVVFLAFVLKNFIAFFPTANAFLWTGGAQAS